MHSPANRSRSANNKRSLSVELSPEGEKLLKQAQKPAERAYNRLMMPLSQEQQAQFVLLLMELTQGLEDRARAAVVPPEFD